MNWIYISLLVIGFVMFSSMAIFILWKQIKKRKNKDAYIPQDIMNDYLEIERRFIESHGETNPYSILYEQSRYPRVARTSEPIDRRESSSQRTKYPTLRSSVPKFSGGREVISFGIAEDTRQTNRSDEGKYSSPKRRSIFSRLRRS
jgi:hypothetical protein